MLPTFYILGAQKAGTTWLAAMLRQHPEVFIPQRKELHFFDQERTFARGSEWYARQFQAGRNARALGEATPNYLAINTRKAGSALERVHALTPHARFIISLRNPVSRAVSALLHAARKGRLPPWADFDRTLREMLAHRVDPWDALAIGRYDVQLAAWFERFPREQFRLLVYEEDVAAHKAQTLRSLCEFLEVNPAPGFRNLDASFNVSVRSRLGLTFARLLPGGIGVALARLVEHHRLARPILFSPETMDALRRYYEPTCRRVEELLGRDLSCWSSPARCVAPPPVNASAIGAIRAKSLATPCPPDVRDGRHPSATPHVPQPSRPAGHPAGSSDCARADCVQTLVRDRRPTNVPAMRLRRLPLTLACLASFVVSICRSAEVEFVRVWPGWRSAESFESISEYFTGQENHGRRVVLRTHPDARAGFYYLVRVANTGVPQQQARFVLHVISPDSPDPKTHTFTVDLEPRASVYQIGLTGPAWPAPEIHPVAWKLELLASDGRVLASAQSFLWEKPAK